MIAHETLRAVALRTRPLSVTLSIAGHGIKRCPSSPSVSRELAHWVRRPLEVHGLAVRSRSGRLVSFCLERVTVLDRDERASAGDPLGAL